ncbi:MAG: bacterio-opsin activator [Oscillospiraceae bacterium]
MKNQSKNYKVYIPRLKQWVGVTEEQYYGYYRDIWATRSRAQNHGQCMCSRSKTLTCDGDCLVCSYHSAGDVHSLDYTIENENGDKTTMLDKLEDGSPSVENVITDKLVLEHLFDRLSEIMPEARRIGELRLAGLSDTQIAKIIGIPRTTFLYHLEKAAQIIQSEYPDMF